MKLSTRGRYGVRAMVDLALHYGQGPITVREISERMKVSPKYLDQLMSSLKSAGLIRNIRKAGRGYIIARSPGEIKISEIIQVLEGSMAPVDCVDDAGTCSQADVCVVRDLWREVKGAIDSVLESCTLEEMAARQKEKGTSNTSIYSI